MGGKNVSKKQEKLNKMISNSIKKLAESIGYEIGLSDNVAQADLINGFSLGLIKGCNDTGYLDMQILGISDSLDRNGKDVILKLAEYVKFDNENKLKN